jgi:hypothetical protein
MLKNVERLRKAARKFLQKEQVSPIAGIAVGAVEVIVIVEIIMRKKS